MRDRGSALQGFSALYDGTGNSAKTVFERVTTKCVVEYELVREAQMAGDRPHRGDPLGKISRLWPTDMLRRKLVAHAQEFVRQIKAQGFEPLTGVYEFEVFGPFTEKVGQPQDFRPEADNPFIPEHEKRSAAKVWGYRGDEFDVSKGVAFLIRGSFTRAAKHGHVSEETGVLLV